MFGKIGKNLVWEGFENLKKYIIYFLIGISFFLSFSIALAQQQKLLICLPITNSTDKSFLNTYLKLLKTDLKERGVLIEIKPCSQKEVKTLLKTGVYSATAEVKIFSSDNKTSIKWKIFFKEKKKRSYSFDVSPKEKDFSSLVKKSSDILIGILNNRPLVEKVEVKGNLRVSKEFILSYIKTKPGDILSYKRLDQDLRAIYKTGYFENVEVILKRDQKGVILIYSVKENPTVKKIIFKGNKEVSSDDLKEIIDIEEGDIVNSKKLDKAISNIKAYYAQLGYTGTKVNISFKKVSPTQVNLIFHIKEGRKMYIKKIEFIGNKVFSDSELKSILSVSEKTVFTPFKKVLRFLRSAVNPEPTPEPGVYNKVFLYNDLSRIETFYKNHGYIDVRVGEPIVKKEPDGVIIKIPIYEGPQYRIGKVKINQDVFPEKKLYKELKTKPGEVFSLMNLLEDKNMLEHLFADYGYAYVRVDTGIQRDKKHRLVDITFNVDKGPVVYINRIEIVGNTKTRDKVIRREIRLAEGWPYSEDRLEDSEIRLRRLGFFKQVRIIKEKGPKENELNLKVKVKETLTGTFRMGGGYSTYDKFMFMFDITERNFLGKGQRLSLSGRIGSRSSRYSLDFYDPYFRDTRYSLGLSLYNLSFMYTDFTKKTKGGSIRIGYDFTSLLSGYIGFRYDDTKLEDLSSNVASIILESRDINITSALQSGLIYDSRNRYFMPTKGSYHRIDFEYAGNFLGGESNYLKIVGEDSIYKPIFKRLIGHIRWGYGYLTEGGAHKIPVFERFYLGGIDSVRGYRYGDISPIDPKTGNRIGGTREFFVQTEGIIPLIKSIDLNCVVFFDMGDVWDREIGFKTSDIRKSVGIGLRWLSPIGPIRLEWGFNIDRKPGEEASNFNFEIGGRF